MRGNRQVPSYNSGCRGALELGRGRDLGRVEPVQGEPQLMVGCGQVAAFFEELGVHHVAAAQALLRAERIEDAPRFAEFGIDTIVLTTLGGDAAKALWAVGYGRLFGKPLGVGSGLDRIGLSRIESRPGDVKAAQAQQDLGTSDLDRRFIE